MSNIASLNAVAQAVNFSMSANTAAFVANQRLAKANVEGCSNLAEVITAHIILPQRQQAVADYVDALHAAKLISFNSMTEMSPDKLKAATLQIAASLYQWAVAVDKDSIKGGSLLNKATPAEFITALATAAVGEEVSKKRAKPAKAKAEIPAEVKVEEAPAA